MKERETGLDIVKALATFLVVCVHFYLSIGYYQTPIATPKMYVMTFVRWGCMAAVPLFLMSTGYFKAKKTISKSHYISLIPIIAAYLVLCIIRMLVENVMYGKIHTFSSAIKSLLTYQSAWYVGMYIGLMLICPFINKAWNACNKREHNILIVSMVVITMMYPLINYVFPSYFQILYPITYYLIGVYIKTYQIKANKLLMILGVVACVAINSFITIVNSMGGIFNPGLIVAVDNGQNAITVAIEAVCLFILFYDVKISNSFVSSLFKSASNCSLEIYLIQAAFNAVIYTYMGRIVNGAENWFWLFFVTAPISFVLSWIAAEIYKKTIGNVVNIVIKKI